MADLLTTSEIARMYGLSDSTVRHYRSSGRLVPTRRTPGGHARYAVEDVVAVLGSPAGAGSASEREPQITGLTRQSFPPLGQHSIGRAEMPASLPAEMIALGMREAPEPPAGQRTRWTPELITRGRVTA